MTTSSHPAAVVVGLCAHGLAIAKALRRSGIRVIAIEANACLPGTRTNAAEVQIVPDIDGDGLPRSLEDLAQQLGATTPPVLFLTNDRMIDVIGRDPVPVTARYRLSWAESSARLLPLLRKENIENRCQITGLAYPRTHVIADPQSVSVACGTLRFPAIIKPSRPLASFKTVIVEDARSLETATARLQGELPIIVQEFIPGGDDVIRFGALYLRDGEIVARFEGRKLRSRPMGHTTIAVSESSNEIHELTRRFFANLRLSGPVSLELKRGPDGTQWVIEPTVGRTDFWVGLCVANNVNLPLIEYRSVTGETHQSCEQVDQVTWVNGERDPLAVPWLAVHSPHLVFGRRIGGVYADVSDRAPFYAAIRRDIRSYSSRAARKLAHVFARR